MKAALAYEAGKPLIVEEVEIPKIFPNEVLVKVKACGICRTEVHRTHEGRALPKTPIIMGHEIGGKVAEIGKSVEDFEIGDRVLVWHYQACGECEHCLLGQENLCDNSSILGINTDGGFAEYVKAKQSSLVRIPTELPYESSTLLCAGLTSFHAVRTIAQVGLGENVVAMGVGGVGLSSVQWANLSGANVIAVDISDQKLEQAKKYGADSTINARKQDVSKEITAVTGGKGADVILEFVGTPQTIENSLASIAKRGKYVFVGYHGKHNFTVHPTRIIGKEIRILGSRAGSRKELEDVIELARNGRFKLLPTKTFSLESLNTALDQLYKGEILGRAVLKP